MKRPIVYAVVVTYYPQADTFLPLMNELVQQTDMVIIVDNTDASDDRFFEVLYKKNSYIEHINIIRLGKNFGIAAALNVGIEAAKIAGCTHVLPVSYTHLDVYKRQVFIWPAFSLRQPWRSTPYRSIQPSALQHFLLPQ